MIKIIVVEDDPLLLKNLAMLISWEKDMELLAAFPAPAGVTETVKQKEPDVMIVDIGLPEQSGIELIQEIKLASPSTHIITYTGYDDKDMIFAAIKAGAVGYILKGSSATEIINAIHEIYEGGAPMTPRIAKAVINELQGLETIGDNTLTGRELDILRAIEQGMSYRDISTRYNITQNTIHTHIKNIYKKTHTQNRHELLIKAKNRGLL